MMFDARFLPPIAHDYIDSPPCVSRRLSLCPPFEVFGTMSPLVAFGVERPLEAPSMKLPATEATFTRRLRAAWTKLGCGLAVGRISLSTFKLFSYTLG
jgi:hypothetical protein